MKNLGDKRKVTINGEVFEVELEPDGNNWKATVEGESFIIEIGGASPTPGKKRRSGKKRKKSGVVSSTIPGKIITVEVDSGQKVSEGDVILILEAMKMQNEVLAPISGTVIEVNCEAGASIEANLPLVIIEPEIEADGDA